MAEERCPYCSEIIGRTDKACPHCHRGLTGKALLTTPPSAQVLNTFPTSSTLLIVVALGAGVIGLFMLSTATAGVGLICGGCLLAVWARMFQASAHHRDIMTKNEATAEVTSR